MARTWPRMPPEQTSTGDSPAAAIRFAAAIERFAALGYVELLVSAVEQRNGMTDDAWRRQHEIFERAYFALLDVPVPVIAAVNGHAYGGGLETALACDFLYVDARAKLALSEVRLGIMPGGGGTQNLARAVGERRAKELVFRAQAFTAQQAYEWGVANHVSEPGRVLEDALAAAADIARNGPLAVRQAKRAIDLGSQTDRTTGLGIEIEAYNRLVPTEDRLEAELASGRHRELVADLECLVSEHPRRELSRALRGDGEHGRRPLRLDLPRRGQSAGSSPGESCAAGAARLPGPWIPGASAPTSG